LNTDKVIEEINKLFDEMGDLPDKSKENRKRLDKIEKYLANL